jgi:hypothetical protein
METISIQVDEEIAKLYREAQLEKQQKIQTIFNKLLKQIIQEKNLDELTEIENNLGFKANEDYPIYSPLNAFSAADTLLKLLEENQDND